MIDDSFLEDYMFKENAPGRYIFGCPGCCTVYARTSEENEISNDIIEEPLFDFPYDMIMAPIELCAECRIQKSALEALLKDISIDSLGK